MPKIIPVDNLENTTNKVTELNDSVTHEQYPSAKAVKEALENVSVDKIEGIESVEDKEYELLDGTSISSGSDAIVMNDTSETTYEIGKILPENHYKVFVHNGCYRLEANHIIPNTFELYKDWTNLIKIAEQGEHVVDENDNVVNENIYHIVTNPEEYIEFKEEQFEGYSSGTSVAGKFRIDGVEEDTYGYTWIHTEYGPTLSIDLYSDRLTDVEKESLKVGGYVYVECSSDGEYSPSAGTTFYNLIMLRIYNLHNIGTINLLSGYIEFNEDFLHDNISNDGVSSDNSYKVSELYAAYEYKYQASGNIAGGNWSSTSGSKNTNISGKGTVGGERNYLNGTQGRVHGMNNTLYSRHGSADGYANFAEVTDDNINESISINGYANYVLNSSGADVSGHHNIILNGTDSTAKGFRNVVKAPNGFVHGQNNIVTNNSQTVLGKFNDYKQSSKENEPKDLFTIGNGKNFANRSNAFGVKEDGTAYVKEQGTDDDSVIKKEYLDERLQGVKTVSEIKSFVFPDGSKLFTNQEHDTNTNLDPKDTISSLALCDTDEREYIAKDISKPVEINTSNRRFFKLPGFYLVNISSITDKGGNTLYTLTQNEFPDHAVYDVLNTEGATVGQLFADTGFLAFDKSPKEDTIVISYKIMHTLGNAVVGSESAALGNDNTIYGWQSFVLGAKNFLKGTQSQILGLRNINKSGDHNLIAGFDNANRGGANNFITGTLNTNNGTENFITGLNNHITGNYGGWQCAVLGKDNQVLDAHGSAAIGEGLTVWGDGNVVVGKYNSFNNNAFEVGTGTSSSNKHTAFGVSKDGSAFVSEQGMNDNSVTQKQYVDKAINELRESIDNSSVLFAQDISQCVDTTKMYVLPDGFIYAYGGFVPKINYYAHGDKIWRGTLDPTNYEAGLLRYTDSYDAKNTDVIPINENAIIDYQGQGGWQAHVYWLKEYRDLAGGYIPEPTEVSDTDNPGRIITPVCVADDTNSQSYTFGDPNNSDDKFKIPEGTKYAMFVSHRKHNKGESNPDSVTLSVFIRENALVQGWMNTGIRFVQTDYEERIAALETQLQNSIGGVLGGKKYVACGDSFTSVAGAYPSHIAERNNMTLVNLAKSGSDFTISDIAEYPFSADTKIDENHKIYKDIPTDADYITLMFGLNECNPGATPPLGDKTLIYKKDDEGQYTTTYDDTNLWGAYSKVFDYILTNMPYAKVGIIIADSWMTETYANAVKGVCKYWGIPYLDLNDASVPMGIGGRYWNEEREEVNTISLRAIELRNNAFTAEDGKHPNAEAHKYRSTIIENFMRSL